MEKYKDQCEELNHSTTALSVSILCRLTSAHRAILKCTQSYLVAVPCVSVAEPLDIVEDEPGEGDDHKNDEGDGDKHYRRSAHILLQVAGSYGDVQRDHDVPLQQGQNLTTFRLWDHDGHDITCTCTHTTQNYQVRCFVDNWRTQPSLKPLKSLCQELST